MGEEVEKLVERLNRSAFNHEASARSDDYKHAQMLREAAAALQRLQADHGHYKSESGRLAVEARRLQGERDEALEWGRNISSGAELAKQIERAEACAQAAEAQVEAMRKAATALVGAVNGLGFEPMLSLSSRQWAHLEPAILNVRRALSAPAEERSLGASRDLSPSITAVTSGQTPITWRGVSRIEYSHDELLGLVETVTNWTQGDLHNIVKAFNGNTLLRLISQADRAALASSTPESGGQLAERLQRERDASMGALAAITVQWEATPDDDDADGWCAISDRRRSQAQTALAELGYGIDWRAVASGERGGLTLLSPTPAEARAVYPEWQPAETVPNDRPVLVDFKGAGPIVAYRDAEYPEMLVRYLGYGKSACWPTVHADYALGWMDLPETRDDTPPKAEADHGK